VDAEVSDAVATIVGHAQALVGGQRVRLKFAAFQQLFSLGAARQVIRLLDTLSG